MKKNRVPDFISCHDVPTQYTNEINIFNYRGTNISPIHTPLFS